MDGIKWLFELRDKVSGPAKAATRGLKAMREELRGSTRELDRFNRAGTGRGSRGAFDPRAMREIGRNARVTGGALGETSTGLSSMVTRLGVVLAGVGAIYVAFRRVASVVGEIAGAIGNLAAEFTRGVVDAGARRMQALTGLRALVGEDAGAALADGEALADFLGTDLFDTVSSLQQLMAQGFTARGSRALFQALADLQTINPSANVQGLTLAIGQIRSKGRLMAEELMQLTEAGLNRSGVLEQIGSARGLSGSRDSIVRQVEQLMARGSINDDEALSAIMRSISSTTGMEIGGLARQASQGLPGMLRRLQNAPQRIFAAIAADSTGAFGGLEELLRSITALLDPASQGFRDFVSIASGGFSVIVDLMRTAWDVGVAFFSGLFGEASESTDPIEDIRAGLQDVRDWLASLRETGTLKEIRAMGAGFMELARAAWPVVRVLGEILFWVGAVAFAFMNLPVIFAGAAAWFANFVSEGRLRLGEFSGMLHGYFAGLGVQAWTWGRNIVQGISMGMQAGVSLIEEGARSIRDRVVGAVEGAFVMNSPSRVMAELGAMAAAGFDQGLDMGDPLRVEPPELGPGASAPAQRGAAPSLTLNIEVNGAGDAQATAQAVHEVVLEAVREVFGRAAGEYRGAFG